MNTRIIVSFKTKDPEAQAHCSHPSDVWYTATKEVDLPREPREREWMEDGILRFNVESVSPSLSGPQWIVYGTSWYTHSWNDMGDVPAYPYASDLEWHQYCKELGWAIRPRHEEALTRI